MKRKRFILIGYGVLLSSLAIAQLPEVKEVDRIKGSTSELVRLNGNSFGTDLSKVAVFFGGAKGSITSIANQLLEVRVPSGATYDRISVANTTSGLIGYTRQQFLLSFRGVHGVSLSKLQTQFDAIAESGLYDHCLCDFDGDTRLDIVTANDNSNFISLFRNNSTVGSYNFTKSSISLGVRSIHTRCGDLNGDGLPDLVVTEGGGGNRVFIFRNTGGFTFSMQTITLSGKKTKRIEMADLDGDGKPELVISDQGSGSIIVLVNQSSVSAISFSSTPVTISIPGAISTDGLAVEDLDGDQLPEIITSQFLSTSGNVFVAKNESLPGNLKLDNITTLTLPGTLVNIKVGDLDGDLKPEIAVTQLLGSSISVFRNQSTSSKIEFGIPQNITTDDRPWGIDFGDVDGDGKTDIVVASITQKSVTVLNNESTTGVFTFQKTIVPTTFINRHVKLGDMDGDGKPDITFTSVDDNNLGVPASKISIIRNAACMVPEISPSGPLTICTGFTLRLFATVGGGVTYEWNKDGTLVTSTTNPFFDVTSSGQYTVTAIAEGGSCSKTSNAVNVTVIAGPPLGPANPTNNGPVCLNNTLQLSVADIGASEYRWSGPNGYTGTGLLPTAIPNFSILKSGRYNLDVFSSGCLTQQTSTIVESVAVPDFRVNVPGSALICQGLNKTLAVVPNSASFTYQWFEKTSGLITGATTSSLLVSASGSYFAQMQSIPYPGCSAVKSDTVKIQVVSIPVPMFTATDINCISQSVQFTNQSTTDTNAIPNYAWNFGDGNTSIDQNPTHIFNTTGNFTVQLTVAYQAGSCSQSFTKSIKIEAPPALTITNPENKFAICEGGNLSLEASGTFISYLWNTAETSPSITIKTPGTYSVEAKASNNCLVNANQVITLLLAPVVTVSATPLEIELGGNSQLMASGLDNYMWSPGKNLSDSTIANPIATPVETTGYTVKGSGSNGCIGTASIDVVVKGDAIVNKLKPVNFFSPNNGDAINNTWSIKNIENFPQCSVAIYDEKGIKVFEGKPYQNTWDGSFNGRQLPIGVYYYIIICDGEENVPKTGSITLIR